MRKLLLFSVFLFMCGCASQGLSIPMGQGIKITAIDWPLLQIQKLIASELPTGMRATSANGREFFSKYFILSETEYKPAGDAIDRFTAKVAVLGSERPYDIEIVVEHERRVQRDGSFRYIVVGYERRLAKELETKLRDELTKSREERNIIDDFRVF